MKKGKILSLITTEEHQNDGMPKITIETKVISYKIKIKNKTKVWHVKHIH